MKLYIKIVTPYFKMNRSVFHFLSLCIVMLSLTMSSCKKFLTQQPKEEVSEDVMFGSVENAYTAVMGVYSHLTGDMAFGNRLSMILPYDDDNINQYQQGSNQEDFKISKFNYNSNNALLGPTFNLLYKGIEHANISIKRIPMMSQYTSGTAAEIAALHRLHGEALTLRAIFYQELIKYWGDVPAPFIPSIDQPELDLPKTNRDTIYNRLIADLKAASELVPWRKEAGVADDERITKGAVKALRARLALFRGGYALRAETKTIQRRADYLTYYAIARDECADMMARRDKHTLNPSFQAIFKDNILARKIEPNGEVMLEVALGGNSNAYDGRIGSFNGPPIYSTSTRRITLFPSYFFSFNPLDSRLLVTAAPYSMGTDGFRRSTSLPGVYDGKFRKDWMPIPLNELSTYYSVNFPLIRFSDVLLMFAEAENEINQAPTAAAKAAYEEVRKRGFGINAANIGATPSTYASFFNAIVNERSFEFGGEGIRKFDLNRWGMLYTKIMEAKDIMAKLGAKTPPYNTGYAANMYYKNTSQDLVYSTSFYVANGSATAPTGYTRVAWTTAIVAAYTNKLAYPYVQNQSELYPLPQTVIDNSRVLKQDYGY